MFDAAILDAAERVLDLCRQRGAMVVTAESCTGGLLAGSLTAVAGSSDIVDCGYVTYSCSAKTALLGVPAALIHAHGAVSAEVARAMVDGIRSHHPERIGVAVTGVAGPGSDSRTKPAGLVYLAAVADGDIVVAENRYGDIGRHAVRMASVRDALMLIASCLRP
ncbi:MAG: CinA family protein [bacterium]|nr:CinA family protein [bacterium]